MPHPPIEGVTSRVYIEPNTTIRFLRNVPLDTTYQHTIYFSSMANQVSYFQGLTKYTLTAQSYQRYRKGVMRVQLIADSLCDCNYIMFQNTGFGTKWFYAFITNVEYVNNVTAEVSYQLDVMQTWHFDYQLGYCFVEREHSATDAVGEHTLPENVDLGEYVVESSTGVKDIADLVIVASTSFGYDIESPAVGQISHGLYSGLEIRQFELTDAGAAELNEWLTQVTEAGKSDGVVSLTVAPRYIALSNIDYRDLPVSVAKQQHSVNGYTPRNRKLLTYPYNFLYVTNLQGNSAEFRYEDFSSTDGFCHFVWNGVCTPSVSIVMHPLNYKRVANNTDEAISLSGFPMLAFNIDSFKAWLAQNGSSLAINSLATAAEVGSAALRSPASAAATGVLAVANTIAEIKREQARPPQARGGAGTNVLAGMRALTFLLMNKCIKYEYALVIDNYFDMFGYACHRLKIPNRNVRPYWTYTKTIDCVAKGSVPADDMAAICGIYNKGITFWNNGANVGNYTLDNTVSG